jgi:RES domain
MVEGQHVVSTLALVDSLEEQVLLEAVLEETKPPVPPDCAHLHYLMFSPFRYGLYPQNSRFRRRGRTPGVFYASEAALTAAAETVWYRFRFFAASPAAPLPMAAAEYSAFAVSIATPFAVDLTVPPLDADAARWTDPDDYSACLDMADSVRAAGGEAIRYASVRDPEARANIAVLTCRAFEGREPVRLETWRIRLRPGRAQVLREFPRGAWEFGVEGTRLRPSVPGTA